MLFVTNRRLVESHRSEIGRCITFELADNEPSASLFFCKRKAPEAYEELTAPIFLNRLRRSTRRQILFYLHGYNSLPEPDIFARAAELQSLCDQLDPELAQIVPLIWPCDDDFGLIRDYWDDSVAAEMSGIAFARAIGKFMSWRERCRTDGQICTKPVNILAHSMGNRVLQSAIAHWTADRGPVASMFRNIFMMAADLPNDCLGPDGSAATLAETCRTLCVYFAADDMALRTSKLMNAGDRFLTKRLGHSGPRDPGATAANVLSIDCDLVNGGTDPYGHTYFLTDAAGEASPVLRHMVAMMTPGLQAADSASQGYSSGQDNNRRVARLSPLGGDLRAANDQPSIPRTGS